MYKFVNPTDTNTIQNVTSLQTLFNGNNLDKELSDDTGSFVTLTVSGRSNLNQRINTIDVPGLDGTNEYSNPTFDIREITIKYKLTDQTKEGFRQRYNRLNSLLDGSKKELAFTDEDAVFYATLQTNEVPEEETNSVIGNLIFLCSDPFKYGPEQQINFTDNVATVVNDGTVDTSPIFQLEVLSPITFAMIQNQNGDYMMIGKPYDIEGMEPTEPYTEIYNNKLNSFTGWSKIPGGYIFDDDLLGGVVDGSLAIGNGQWYVKDYGSNPNGWHGPSRKTSFEKSIQNFQVKHYITSLSYTGQLGKNALFLLDDNNNIVASMGVVDQTISKWNNHVVFNLAGNKQIFKFQGFNNTQMWLRLTRKDTLFTAEVYQLDKNGNVHNKVSRVFEDLNGQYQAPITQAAVYVSNYKDYFAIPMYVNQLQVNQVNNISENQIPFIAKQGDVITFDHDKQNLLINGESRKDLKDFGGSYFRLLTGHNELFSYPKGSIQSICNYRKKFL
ncbi:distal tail protein Dit [Virgibacillus sp. Bac332]|uniref:distal tail protein Dit n=1 Tax=Virgibacillus sp. Bac332 TaxID=2419842 RepID=UPI000EF50DE0|nr:distal tail protein Dit [Virgibacillus sp. Bac332]